MSMLKVALYSGERSKIVGFKVDCNCGVLFMVLQTRTSTTQKLLSHSKFMCRNAVVN